MLCDVTDEDDENDRGQDEYDPADDYEGDESVELPPAVEELVRRQLADAREAMLSSVQDAVSEAGRLFEQPLRLPKVKLDLGSDLGGEEATVLANIAQIARVVELPPVREEIARVARSISGTFERFTPPNFRGLSVDDMFRLPAISEEQRLGLLWAPRVEVLRDLLAADDADARGRVVEARADYVVRDFRPVAEDAGMAGHDDLVALLLEAIDAYEAGHPRAAQALATSVIDTAAMKEFPGAKGKGSTNAIRRQAGTRGPNDQFWQFIDAVAVAGIPLIYEGSYEYRSGVSLYHRKGTAHCADLTVFSVPNAARAISLTACLLRWLKRERLDETAFD